MTLADLARIALCLGLLACTTLLVANMRPRLFSRDSYWLMGYVFIISLSIFIAAADHVGSEEPIKWYGTPLRMIGVFAALVYIWKTRPQKGTK